MEILKVEHLVKKYGKGDSEVTAVNDVSFSVNQGEFVAIVGSSGSGKSTLLHLLGGVDRPTSGKVYIQGEDIYSLNNDKMAIFRRRQVGIIYQFYNLVSDLNVYENVEVCHWLGDKSIKIDDILDRVGMAEHKKKFPDELSGGMQQRVSIARAIAKNPKILFCDEPTGALDYKSAHDVLEVIEDIHKKSNTTIIIVTHNIAIADMSDHIIEIRDGVVALDQHNDKVLSASEVEW